MGKKTAYQASPVEKNESVRGAPAVKTVPDTTPEAERSLLRIRELTVQRNELRRQIDEQRKQVSSLHHEGITTSLDEFYSFFEGYTHYFWNLTPDQLGDLDSTYESVLNRALTNMRGLWEQLSMAINQRYNPVYRDRLAAADDKARSIMERTKAVSIVHGLPILYYNKQFQISRHPYQTYPLLGISPDIHDDEEATSLFQEDASLAHELGHHVFWNNGELDQYASRLEVIDGVIANTVLAEFPFNLDNSLGAVRLSDIRSRFLRYNIWLDWIEESFADVFGTLIIGPRFAKSAQDILIREGIGRPSDLILSDGEHPVPALRPLISLETLRIIANESKDIQFKTDLTALTATLDARWDTIWQEAIEEEHRSRAAARITLGPQHHVEGDTIPPKLDELKPLVPKIVNLILTTLRFASPNGGMQPAETLLSVLDYWGKAPKDTYTSEMQQLLQELEGDRLSTLAKRSAAGGREGASSSVVAEDSRPFDQFLEFVKSRTSLDPDTFGDPHREWQIVLGFDLTLSHGVQSGCHKHTLAYGTVEC